MIDRDDAKKCKKKVPYDSVESMNPISRADRTYQSVADEKSKSRSSSVRLSLDATARSRRETEFTEEEEEVQTMRNVLP